MLNRRNLRIKGIQAVYAYREKVNSNFSLALDSIDDFFAPDLNSEEAPDYKGLKKQAKKAKTYLTSIHDKEEPEHCDDDQVLAAVKQAEKIFREKNADDLKKNRQQMLADAENVMTHYGAMLLFLEEFLHMNLKTHQTALVNNQALLALSELDAFKDLVTRKNLAWDRDDSLIKKVFRDQVKESDEYKAYNKTAEHDYETDAEFLLWLTKSVVFKNELLDEHFADLDLHWEENRKIVHSLVKKTIKYLSKGEAMIFQLSENWEEDKAYFEKLYDVSVQEDEEIQVLLEEVLQNWDVERVAVLDKIIIEMALQEMISFPSIPIKVTMNEFIDIAKNYSTPKSKVFINGVLDGLSKKLVNKGTIRKSGRGLIDNK